MYRYPAGLRLVHAANIDDTPWFWALNGVFSVLCSALAVFVSIYVGISANFYLAAGCYSVLLIGVYFMFRATQKTASVGD